MQEDRDQKREDTTGDDATSSETLSDVEEKEDVSEEPGDGGSSAPLSPDGAVATDNSERSPKDDVGPM